MCMCYIPGLSHLSHASTRHVKRVATYLWPLVPHITSHTPLGMIYWFANPAESWPIDLVVYGLDGGHPHLCVASNACDTLPMHP